MQRKNAGTEPEQNHLGKPSDRPQGPSPSPLMMKMMGMIMMDMLVGGVLEAGSEGCWGMDGSIEWSHQQ